MEEVVADEEVDEEVEEEQMKRDGLLKKKGVMLMGVVMVGIKYSMVQSIV